MGEYYRQIIKFLIKISSMGRVFPIYAGTRAVPLAGRLWTPEQEKRFQKNFLKKFVQRVIGELQRASIRVCTTQSGHDDFFNVRIQERRTLIIVVPVRTRDFS
jgi:hypothetical protein